MAFYYAFNAHYTAWLVVPAAVGGFLFGLSFFAAQQVTLTLALTRCPDPSPNQVP